MSEGTKFAILLIMLAQLFQCVDSDAQTKALKSIATSLERLR